ncbi:GNAT family N-acetyltransferase [Leifsonia sp. NPDC058292]|uniref:GNAT family N-acetyltransferase n=1 Tax=Leifsonia sp. NPDC058292 TaxID=3346428 RepID=UPI0036DF047F
MSTAAPLEPVVLTGSSVVLSIPGERDIDRIAELCREEAISTWTTVPEPYTRADAESFVMGMVTRGWAQGTGCTWAIRREARGTLVGMIGLDGIGDGEAELGFWLAPDARGLGLMSQAVSLVIDFAFEPAALGLQRVVWHAFTGNAASASVARRAGFRFEGTRRLGGSQRGRRLDDWQAALLATDAREPAAGWPEPTFVQRSPA